MHQPIIGHRLLGGPLLGRILGSTCDHPVGRVLVIQEGDQVAEAREQVCPVPSVGEALSLGDGRR